MQLGFFQEHWVDENEKPAGGVTFGVGFCISWQNGPLGRGEDRQATNGCFMEDIIAAAANRLKFYNEAGFGCEENDNALAHLSLALDALNKRTKRREHERVEGTHGRRKESAGKSEYTND